MTPSFHLKRRADKATCTEPLPYTAILSQTAFNGGRLVSRVRVSSVCAGGLALRLNWILPPQEASIASAAEFLRYQYPILRTAPAGLAFSPLSMASLPWAGRGRKVSLPSGSRMRRVPAA